MCLLGNLPFNEEDLENEIGQDDGFDNNNINDYDILQEGTDRRRQLIQQYFTR